MAEELGATPPDWPLLPWDRVELEIRGLWALYDHLRHDMDELAARVSELEAQRAMDEED